MSGLVLRVDGRRWRDHLQAVQQETPGLVPVAKGNGYGFGLRRLAEEATRLGVATVAVGQVEEVATVREGFDGDIVILTPWREENALAEDLLGDPRVITTVSRVADLQLIKDRVERPRVIVELLTSMTRYGVALDQLAALEPLLQRVELAGWTIHLPINEQGRYAEAERLARAALGVRRTPLWLSHLPVADARRLAAEVGGPDGVALLRLRVGTRLWLGAPASLQPRATVLDVHQVSRGDRVGYRGRKVGSDGWVLVLAGGTAHGVGLEAPTAAVSLRQRAVSLATGSLEAAGFALSPYTVAGKKRWFVEPPHMQSSLVFLPRTATPPQLGDEVPVELRLTTAVVDHVLEV